METNTSTATKEATMATTIVQAKVVEREPDADLVSDERIEKLMRAAGEAGDLEQVAICRDALAGSRSARAKCIDVILEFDGENS